MGLLQDIASSLVALTDLAREWGYDRRRAGALEPVLSHPQADPVLTLEQAELYSGLTGKTLKTDALAGKIATIRRTEGGHFRVRLSDLNLYLDGQRQAAFAAEKARRSGIDWSV